MRGLVNQSLLDGMLTGILQDMSAAIESLMKNTKSQIAVYCNSYIRSHGLSGRGLLHVAATSSGIPLRAEGMFAKRDPHAVSKACAVTVWNK